MSSPSHILIFGATGQIGHHITTSILTATPPFPQISIFTSPQTLASKPSQIASLRSLGAQILVGDLTNPSDVLSAYKTVDTVVSAVGRGAIETQTELVRLAVEAGVKWFFPSEYGTDIEYGPDSAGERPHQGKLKVRRYLRERAESLKHTFLVTGPYADMFFSLSKAAPEAGGFDLDAKKAVLVGDGEGKIGFTTMPDVGKALVAALQHPSPSTNAALKVQSFVTTPRQILAEFEKQTGGEPWTVSYTPLQTLRDAEQKAWDRGDPTATIYTLRRIWAEGGTLYDETDNERIGLRGDELESVEDAVRRALSTGL